MAKKNLFVKRGIVADSNAYDQSRRLRTGGDYSHAGYTSPSPFHPPPPPVWGPHGYMAPPPPPYDPYGGYHVPPVPMPSPAPVPAPSSYVPVQGAVIPSSGSVGMRIQYSKNPFGKRKDLIHPGVAAAANGTPQALTYQ